MAPPVANKADDELIPSDPDDSDFELEAYKLKKKSLARDANSDDESDSSDDSDDSDDDEPQRKRRKQDVTSDQAAQSTGLSKEAVDDLWAQFNASDETDHAAVSSSTASAKPIPPKLITITVEYEFVGETITQEKQVPEDSVEAKAWLARQALKGKSVSTDKGKAIADVAPATTASSTSSMPVNVNLATIRNGTSSAKGLAASTEDAGFETTSTSPLESRPGSGIEAPESPAASTIPSSAAPPSANPTPATTANSNTSAKPKPPPGPRRRPAGGGLAGMAAALSSKPAKLNTLEKSKLDWNKFVSKDQALAETLDHARKDITGTGAESGYLGKQAFLGRADAARDKAWEESKKKRR